MNKSKKEDWKIKLIFILGNNPISNKFINFRKVKFDFRGFLIKGRGSQTFWTTTKKQFYPMTLKFFFIFDVVSHFKLHDTLLGKVWRPFFKSLRTTELRLCRNFENKTFG